ncbi:subtype I-C CRISPR-associated endonuclease Cas1 [Desulfobacter hydrogenophilus]|uniref:CRISPR-associated endonuclease Cas1 n=1 Tax=Desulfobacter hydrogenophilus TaxID=2291 RepID=A0A328FKY8_9BACT|nr:type I-C CRISPR-associated endonuclease Cas1c [Desulfobacter hydrogenophilus]NDY70582.1 type I-C CRISPR-associated endonuclease Cas1 [Desulfobacter hydrogenophilus]QBH13952.1 type I-C CRISPR-associated endonuclease Cas1 [Desulfobacter hydrogenophilus]RAM03635.1 subtype I-C CRISPR-associated endonuclease Cas1 [Desulfobacter hydrogenophilus]
MKKHLNTLFVTTQGAYLGKDGETVAVKIEQKTVLRIPIHTLDGIVCFGAVGCSPYLMGFCAEKDVAISFLTEYGKFLAMVKGPVSGNVLLRRKQFRMADKPGVSAQVAGFVLTGKIANCRTVLERSLRDHSEKMDQSSVKKVSNRLSMYIRKELQKDNLDSLRGIEGDAAHQYFSVFDELIFQQKDAFGFSGRNRRPPTDRVNCLLSFVYTLLVHDIRSALESVGLDTSVGFLHRDRPGRPGLALDMMEEFRPFLADRLVLSMINRSQVRPDGFTIKESGAVHMDDDTRKTVLTTYQKRKQESLVHPFLNEKIQIGTLFFIQALLLARFIRGDLDGYPPFIWK